MVSIIAKVHFYENDKSKRSHWFDGMQPLFNIDNINWMCVVTSIENKELLKVGEDHEVLIELHSGELISNVKQVGYEFYLCSGNRRIASGIILEV